MYSPSRSPLPPPSLPAPSGSSQCTRPEHLSHASHLAGFTIDNIHGWMALSSYHHQGPATVAFSLVITAVSLYSLNSEVRVGLLKHKPHHATPQLRVLYWLLSALRAQTKSSPHSVYMSACSEPLTLLTSPFLPLPLTRSAPALLHSTSYSSALNTVPPQGLCTCHPHCLECSSPGIHMAHPSLPSGFCSTVTNQQSFL